MIANEIVSPTSESIKVLAKIVFTLKIVYSEIFVWFLCSISVLIACLMVLSRKELYRPRNKIIKYISK